MFDAQDIESFIGGDFRVQHFADESLTGEPEVEFRGPTSNYSDLEPGWIYAHVDWYAKRSSNENDGAWMDQPGTEVLSLPAYDELPDSDSEGNLVFISGKYVTTLFPRDGDHLDSDKVQKS